MIRLLPFFLSCLLLVPQAFSQTAKKKPAKPKLTPSAEKNREIRSRERAAANLETISFDDRAGPVIRHARKGHQLDAPALARTPEGEIRVLYLVHDGQTDRLEFAALSEGELEVLAVLAPEGVLHHPALAIDGEGTAWCFWSERAGDGRMELMGLKVRDGEAEEEFTVASSKGSDSFAVAGTDAKGRVWVAWQSMRNHRPDVMAKCFGKSQSAIRVSPAAEGDWEPAIAFDGDGNAWISYDSAAGNEFNLMLARVGEDGSVKHWPIAHSAYYEARSSIVPTAAGDGFWIAAEQGKQRWGLDSRGHGNATGINAAKSILFGRFDLWDESFEAFPLGHAGKAGNPVNLPAIGVDAKGRPWVSYRYFGQSLWRVAMTRMDPATGKWTSRRQVEDSNFGQDRTSQFARDAEGRLWHCWTSDLRDDKTAKEAGIHLAAISADLELPPANDAAVKRPPTAAIPPSQATPERPFEDRHSWTVDGETYKLYWGDVHRHTDVSNCRTGFDGCIVEHFRYAYDMGKLDFMGTSDHTDVGKIYDPYEWWHNQKMHDALHAPGQFNTVYVYEREQRWPWGHRNVVFADHGAPVVYIQRKRYLNSTWQKQWPVENKGGEISPYELWEILKKTGISAAVVSHTGATGMGTDWGRYDQIDYDIETLVEIFQGARVSYEGAGAPQPTVGLRPKEKYTINGDAKNPPPPPAPIERFGKYSQGSYQSALRLGRRLGVFASSDHISSHVAYGGVYCKEFTREGIIEGLLARRTIAATDKIYVDFTCNGQPLGQILETNEKPTLWFRVNGTAPIKEITLVRNEGNWKTFDDIEGTDFEIEVVDEEPGEKENRYYVRVVQEDGNMAWSSPVWVMVKE